MTPELPTSSTDLLADIIAFRDECREAQRDLIGMSDPTGHARLAFTACANQLTEIIERHQNMDHSQKPTDGGHQ